MSVEFVRRRLVIRLQSTPDSVYVNKLTNKIVALEKSLNSEVEFVNYPSGNGSIAVKFKNGDSYEFLNYRDPYKDKNKRPPDYKPPEIEYKKLTVEIKEDAPEEKFGIFWFCIYALLVAIAVLDVFVCWFIVTHLR
ncbi:MAG: hypothetical protein LBQ76_06010 [Candidatus Fibromonas sp.]|jgi:dipeptidase|nr:hypothetical protein [Candidatus Fibromonas sp.]